MDEVGTASHPLGRLGTALVGSVGVNAVVTAPRVAAGHLVDEKTLVLQRQRLDRCQGFGVCPAGSCTSSSMVPVPGATVTASCSRTAWSINR